MATGIGSLPMALDPPIRNVAAPRPSAQAPRHGRAPAGRHGILETKILVPRRTHPLVARPRLTDRLTADADVPLIGVIGPAGYGKTTLLAQLAASDRRAVAWLTLDERDTDPMGLLRYVAAAVDRATGLPGSVLGSVGGADPSDWQTALSQLSDALTRTRQPLLLVLDDVERIGSGESCEAIVALASLLPAGSQLALASRRADGLPVPRLVAAGMLTLIERDELALVDAEAAELLRIVGRPLPAERAAELNHAMEGWAAGLYLSAVTHRAGVDGLEEDDLTAGRRIVADYLHDEILASLPRDDVELALRASLLDRLDAGIVEAVVGVTDADRILRDLARTTPLLIELDDSGDWYRWHRFLREPLVAELRHRDASAEAALLERAAGSYERAGLLETSLDYAMRAGDRDRIGRLLPGLAQAAWNSGRVDAALGWFDWLEANDAPGRHPTVAMLGSLIFGLVGRSARALLWADLAHVDEPADIPEGDRGLGALVRASLCRGGVTRMAEHAEDALRALRFDSAWSPAARILLGVALALEGRSRTADVELASATELAIAAGTSPTHAAIGLVFRASLALERGEWTTAEDVLRQARALVIDGGPSEGAAGFAVDAVSARVAARRGAHRQAMTDAQHADRLRTTVGHAVPWLAIRARLDLAWALIALAEPAGAVRLLVEIDEILGREPDMGVLALEVNELREHLERSHDGPIGAAMLTLAELRLLPLLATHHSLPEIAARLGRSTNTIKTQAKSIYRKLDASSRSESIERARSLGLLDAAGQGEALSA
jgi:LuxR family transcriptional regulator, maltose regulon positive regulatory protein